MVPVWNARGLRLGKGVSADFVFYGFDLPRPFRELKQLEHPNFGSRTHVIGWCQSGFGVAYYWFLQGLHFSKSKFSKHFKEIILLEGGPHHQESF